MNSNQQIEIKKVIFLQFTYEGRLKEASVKGF